MLVETGPFSSGHPALLKRPPNLSMWFQWIVNMVLFAFVLAGSVSYKHVEEAIVKQGIPVDDLASCLKYYSALTLLSVMEDGTNITLHC